MPQKQFLQKYLQHWNLFTPRALFIEPFVLRIFSLAIQENLQRFPLNFKNIRNLNLKVKLTEFGMVRPVDSIIRHTELVSSYHAPELCERVPNETYSVTKQTDIWAIGKCNFS
jgi:serine/threonine protein kinase